MHIAHKQLRGIRLSTLRQAVAHLLLDAVAHSTRGPVGECQTEHILESYALLSCSHDALREDIGLAAARRGKHQKMPIGGLYGTLLFFVVLHKRLSNRKTVDKSSELFPYYQQ